MPCIHKSDRYPKTSGIAWKIHEMTVDVSLGNVSRGKGCF